MVAITAVRARMLYENQWKMRIELYTMKNAMMAKKTITHTEAPNPSAELACAVSELVYMSIKHI